MLAPPRSSTGGFHPGRDAEGLGCKRGRREHRAAPRAVAPHLPPQHQQPRVGVEQRDHGPAKGRRALSTAERGSAPCPGTWQRPNSHGAGSCPLSPFPRCSPKPQDHGRWAHAGGFPAMPTAPGHCRVPSVRRMGTALSISPIYSLPWHGPAPLSPAVTALWPRDLGAWHGSAGTGHTDAKCGRGSPGLAWPRCGTALGLPGPAQPVRDGHGAAGRSRHAARLTGTRRPASPAVGATGWAGQSVPVPVPVPIPPSGWRGRGAPKPFSSFPTMRVEEKAPEAASRRTKGQYITFGLTFLWSCRLGEGSTCSAGVLHGTTLRKRSPTKAPGPVRPPQPVPSAGSPVPTAGPHGGDAAEDVVGWPGDTGDSPGWHGTIPARGFWHNLGKQHWGGSGRHGGPLPGCGHRCQHCHRRWDKDTSGCRDTSKR